MAKQWIGAAAGNFVKGRSPRFHPEAIVIHIMEGTLGGTSAWFNNPSAKVSAHYGVGKTGQLQQYVSEPDTAFHAGIVDNPSWVLLKPHVNPNHYTIGIEHEGFSNDDWSQDQYRASANLVAEIAARWNITLDRLHVVGHREIRASKTCPGFRVNLHALVDLARQAPPTNFTSKSPRLKIEEDTSVREACPSIAAKVVRVINKGSDCDVVEFTNAGETIRGNSYWYKDRDGNFVWAGDTDRPDPTI
jgi:N-acetylmuramoyl-L-alanine amidase